MTTDRRVWVWVDGCAYTPETLEWKAQRVVDDGSGLRSQFWRDGQWNDSPLTVDETAAFTALSTGLNHESS